MARKRREYSAAERRELWQRWKQGASFAEIARALDRVPERAYVALTRGQERTDLYVSREDLGEQGIDTGAIERLGEAMAESRAQQASIAAPTAERAYGGIDAGLEPTTSRLGPGVEASSTIGLDTRQEAENHESKAAQLTCGDQQQHHRDEGLGWALE
jgi:hypothetical protein